jgi:hypothetical protein
MRGCSLRSSTKEPQAPRRAGFPRLVGPSEWDCFLSVKSVDRIEVTRQPQRATAAAIALARLERLATITPAAGPIAQPEPA